jgi:hypothetical protein
MNTTERTLETIGQNAYESIVDMVAAMDVDYDRINELISEIDDIKGCIRDIDEGQSQWAFPYQVRDEKSTELETLTQELAELQQDVYDPSITCREDAEQRIQEDALSVEVRSGWTTLDNALEAEEFMILLTTGGPAVRIRGELDQYKTPDRAWLETQDWGTPWARYFDADQDVLLTYCQQFYYGE